MADYMQHLDSISTGDVASLHEARKSYGDSWKKRGGTNAFFMLCRKWDRLDLQVEKHHYDIFAAAVADTRVEGIIDDIRDLRRYLILVEAEIIERQRKVAAESTPYANMKTVDVDMMRAEAMRQQRCDCGNPPGTPHRYGCAVLMGGGEHG